MTQVNEDNLLPEDVDLRPLRPEGQDLGFILKTLTQAMHKFPHLSWVPNNIFFPKETQILSSVLNSGAKVLVASIKGYPDDLMGYVLYDDRVPGYLILHWIFVKGIFRRKQLAHLLLEALQPGERIWLVTNGTPKHYLSFKEHYPKAVFNPFLWSESV